MIDKKREIFIKIEKIKEIVSILEEIQEKEKYIRKLFVHYDKINLEENKIFDNWNVYLDDINQKLVHITL